MCSIKYNKNGLLIKLRCLCRRKAKKKVLHEYKKRDVVFTFAKKDIGKLQQP